MRAGAGSELRHYRQIGHGRVAGYPHWPTEDMQPQFQSYRSVLPGLRFAANGGAATRTRWPASGRLNLDIFKRSHYRRIANGSQCE